MPAESGESAIEEVEDAGSENKPDGVMDLEAGVGKGNRCACGSGEDHGAFDNLEGGCEPAKEVSRRHEVGKQVDFWSFVLAHRIGMLPWRLNY